MNCETGELIVLDINSAPDLSPASPLFGQAAAAEAQPMLPHELLERVRGAAAPLPGRASA